MGPSQRRVGPNPHTQQAFSLCIIYHQSPLVPFLCESYRVTGVLRLAPSDTRENLGIAHHLTTVSYQDVRWSQNV
jgi:hypothetical protein